MWRKTLFILDCKKHRHHLSRLKIHYLRYRELLQCTQPISTDNHLLVNYKKIPFEDEITFLYVVDAANVLNPIGLHEPFTRYLIWASVLNLKLWSSNTTSSLLDSPYSPKQFTYILINFWHLKDDSSKCNFWSRLTLKSSRLLFHLPNPRFLTGGFLLYSHLS